MPELHTKVAADSVEWSLVGGMRQQQYLGQARTGDVAAEI